METILLNAEEKINADKLILEFKLLKNPFASTFNFAPHSEQKSPS